MVYMKIKIQESKEDKEIGCSMCCRKMNVSSTAVSAICWACVAKMQDEINHPPKDIFNDRKSPSVLGSTA